MSILSAVRILGASACVAALTSCGGDPGPVYAQAFGFNCGLHESTTARQLCRRTGDPGAAQVSRYCYQTLAKPNCFDRPDPDSKNQALGSSGY